MPESPQAKMALGLAIFQDLAAILFMILVPAVASQSGSEDIALSGALLKGVSFTIGMLVISKFGLPQILDAVAKTNSRELFTVTVIGLCAAVAMVSGVLGLSPALGAFAAGVVVSESIYSHRVLSDVLPFKDLFLTIFFVSVGLLIDLKVAAAEWVIISIISISLIALKGSIVILASRLAGLTIGRTLIVSAALCSTGEFSIVILNRAMDFDFFPSRWEQIILACTAVSMALVPTLMKLMQPFSCRVRHQKDEIEEANHQIPVVILELNPKTVKKLISEGTYSIFGDAKDPEVLKLASIKTARGIALTFPDKNLAAATALEARKHKSDIILYARCKFKVNLPAYEDAGITHIMLDEEQSGRAMIKSVMQSYSTEFDESWI